MGEVVERIMRGGDRGLTIGGGDYDQALAILREETSCQIFTEDALVVRLVDRPGALAELASRFKDAGVNLRSMHIIERRNGDSLASIVADDRGRAEKLVRDVLV